VDEHIYNLIKGNRLSFNLARLGLTAHATGPVALFVAVFLAAALVVVLVRFL